MTAPAPDRMMERSVNTEIGRPGWRQGAFGDALLQWHDLCGVPDSLLDAVANAQEPEDAIATVAQYTGQFGLILQRKEWAVGLCDAVASVPLFLHADAAGRHRLSPSPERTGPQGKPLAFSASERAVLALGGYTIGARTLDPSVQRIGCGQAAVVVPDAAPRIRRYRDFAPERGLSAPVDDADAEGRLAALTLALLKDLVESAAGRTILVPLSAGRDSRLIVAALSHLGYAAVKCFSYGLPGNHEAAMAGRIADRLGYQWTFVPQTPRIMRRFFQSEFCADFEDRMDTLSAVPFQQDLHSLHELLGSGYADRDMIVVNGQSGDFITGNHIPMALCGDAGLQTGPAATDQAIGQLISKHFDLWSSLRTPEREAQLRAALRADLDDLCGAPDRIPAAALYERSEFANRQSKYVVNGQRTYDYLGLEWRLPLWDSRFIDFWQRMPLWAKARQRLYAEMLSRQNWGDVWGSAWRINAKTVRPLWLAGLRQFCKPVFAPLPRSWWKAYDKRVFHWGIDPVANYAIASYRDVLTNRLGHRNAISWHVRQYLARKGYGLSGRRLFE
jgi:asparagine synthase (glutamine-hydrolysing)